MVEVFFFFCMKQVLSQVAGKSLTGILNVSCSRGVSFFFLILFKSNRKHFLQLTS